MPGVDKTLENLTLHLLTIEERFKNPAQTDVAVATVFLAKGKGTFFSPRKDYTAEKRTARQKEITERKKNTMCWRCGQSGHWGRECTATKEEQKEHQDSHMQLKRSIKGYQVWQTWHIQSFHGLL